MERRILILTIALIAILAVVNTTVYAYRWITGTITVGDATTATGAACTGFYSSADQSGIPLPTVGTNYNAPTYGGNTITVTPGNTVCQFTYNNTDYYLYESIQVSIPVTVGSWYIQDFYGFGYYSGSDPVYVYFRVDEDATDGGVLTTAYLIIRDTNGNELDRINLLTLGNMTDPLTLNPGGAFRLDLYIDAAAAGSVSFKVGVYVTQTSGEAPAP